MDIDEFGEGGVTVAGEKDAVAPLGSPDALKLTVPENPFNGTNVNP
ncbi:MAG: hypothetical protein WB780_00555 [Candidatus Acidiferrales bacterium]